MTALTFAEIDEMPEVTRTNRPRLTFGREVR